MASYLWSMKRDVYTGKKHGIYKGTLDVCSIKDDQKEQHQHRTKTQSTSYNPKSIRSFDILLGAKVCQLDLFCNKGELIEVMKLRLHSAIS